MGSHGRIDAVASSREDALQRDVTIPTDTVALPGELVVPPGAAGVVVFAHGSGSSRRSPRNVAVARALNRGGLGTLLFDLLTSEEAADRRNVFDVPLLARRLEAARQFLSARPETASLPVEYFGASTGAAAALWAAAEEQAGVRAVVSRGGRPDLAGPRLGQVRAPTLLIVGGADELVLELNRRALSLLPGSGNELVVVPGATHLFEEPGALERVADLACRWFTAHALGQAVQS
jgi:putative phosphoribosyl transferase